MTTYELGLKRVADALSAITRDRTLFNLSQQRRLRVEPGRIKEADRLLAKSQNPKYAGRIKDPSDVFDVITDVAATRVTCNTVRDVQAITRAVQNSATLPPPAGISKEKVSEDYIEQPKPSGYRAVHLLVEVDVPQGSKYVPVVCEIQIRTLLQHSWGELTHEDTFKPGVRVPQLVTSLSKRLATALAVLDEIAQDLRDELEKIEVGTTSQYPLDETAADGRATRPVPKPRVSIDMLREVFEEVIGRTMNLTSSEEEAIQKSFSLAGLTDRSHVLNSLIAASKATREAFVLHPVQLSDSDMLSAASKYSEHEDRAVANEVSRLAAVKEERISSLQEFEDTYAPGEVFIGTLVRVASRYALVQLSTGETAVLSVRHLEQGKPTRVDLEDVISPGESIRVEVVNVSPQEHRIEVRPVTDILGRRES
ncbi:hypothetical protein [Kibdelosporangium phytohabitans]|uniref:hypothetical protein n=1 Tax=Kibdelosporangium phytohabitans TaxID=860235 RepID=UPI0014701676|nr:hypothetical protein [Kibdelosporangium phytohabitans]MBE1463809.1 ppGpp synthetase/RelA/SpoT-type nucleotidyltransferase [Kibdelosporangium phytohabitans]